MPIFTMQEEDENGEIIETSYEVHDDVIEYITQCDEDHAILFAQFMAALAEVDELKTMVEAYEIFCSGREALN